MKQILLSLLVTSIFISCKGNTEKTVGDQVESPIVMGSDGNSEGENASVDQEVSYESLFTEFDWSSIPLSSADIGEFPYISVPEGSMVLEKGRVTKKSEDGMTSFFEFNKVISYNGVKFFETKGKKAELRIGKVNRNDVWSDLNFEDNVNEYLLSLGAVQLFKGKIPIEKLKVLKETDKRIALHYIFGEPYGIDPVYHYALNHNQGKIIFQVWSSRTRGVIGILEAKNYKLSTPTASAMKTEIDNTGKAVLNINFDLNTATMQSDGQKFVDQIVILLDQNVDLNLSIEGHTDNTGTTDRNKNLSKQRAQTVMDALMVQGIDNDRLKSNGYGSDRPIVANDTEEHKAQNGRVELVKM